MKIAFFTDSYYPQVSGVTMSVDYFAKELRKKGHIVYVIAPRVKEYTDTDPFVWRLRSIKVLSSEPEVRFPTYITNKSIIKILRTNFDIVHAHGNGAFSLLGYQIARIKGIPYILTFHTLFTEYTHYIFNGKVIRPRMAAAGLRMFARLCDGIIAPSLKMKNALQKFGVKKDIAVIPNFVNLEAFTQSQKGYLHKKLGLVKDIPLLLSVGRLGKEKNFAFILRAFSEIAKKEKSSHLVIVREGQEKARLLKQALALDIEKRVHLIGKIKPMDMPKVYADGAIFLFASTTEVHPMVILEAAASSLPFIVVEDLAYSEMVVANENAFVTSENEEAFAKKVVKLLNNKKVQKQFGKNSREKMKKYFNPDMLITRLIGVYENALSRKKRFRPMRTLTWPIRKTDKLYTSMFHA